MVLGLEVLVVKTPLEDFTVRVARSSAPPQGKAGALARRFANEIRFGLESRDPSVMQAARELVGMLEGGAFDLGRELSRGADPFAGVVRRGMDGPAFGDIFGDVASRLESALLAGRLVVDREELAPLTERSDAFEPPLPPLPPAPRESGASAFEVRFIDEVGRAIAGIDAEFTADGPQTRVTNAAGIALLEGVRAGSASVSILDSEGLSEILEPRWEKFRPGKPPKESNTQEVVFRGNELGPFSLKPEVPNTVVIRPPLGKLFVELWDKTGRVKLANCDYVIAGPARFRGKTDADGRLRHDDVFPGDYTLSVALGAFEGTPDAQVDILEIPLVVLEPGAPPQVRSIGAVPRVVMARLRGMTFETNKTFLLPTAVQAMEHMRELYRQNLHSQLLIVGHADTTGEPSVNDPLSRDRARSMRAYLQDDVETWLKNYDAPGKQKWGTREDRLMISAAAGFKLRGPNEDIIEWFQRTRDLKVDGKAGPETRRRLITEYMQLDGVNLIEDQELNLVIESHGAGENFPLDETGLDIDQIAIADVDDVFNRRVELFFFDDEFGVVPTPGAPDGPEYLEWRKRAAENVDAVAGPAKPAPVTLLEVQDTFFRTDSAVVQQNLVCPSVFALALKFAQASPSTRLVIAGHADTRASDAHNQPLSEERADSALACLVGDRDSFVRLSLKRHKVADAKQILKFATVKLGFDCDPGSLDESESTLQGSSRKFQEQYNAKRAALGVPTSVALNPDGKIGPLTWGAFFDCYEAFLAAQVSAAATIDAQLTELRSLRALLKFVADDKKTIGFGEEYPADRPGVDNVASATNRRVELLFFPQTDLPDLTLPNDISDIYLPGRYRRRAIDPCGEPPPPPPPPPPRSSAQSSSIFVRAVVADGRRVTDVEIFLFDVSIGRSQIGSNFSTTGETDFGPRRPGQYEVDVAKAGFTGGPVNFTVSPNQREVVSVLLTPLGQTEDAHFEIERFTTVFEMVTKKQILAFGVPVEGDVVISSPPSLRGRTFADAGGAAVVRDAQAAKEHDAAVDVRIAGIRSQKGAKFIRAERDLLPAVVTEDFSVEKEKTQGGDKSRQGPITEAELVETDKVTTTTIIITTVRN